jgi:surface-anchored protein
MVWSTLLSSLKARGNSARRVPRGLRGRRTVLSLEILEERNLLAICSLPPLLTGHVDGIEANFVNGQWQMGTWERDPDIHDAPGAVLFVAKPNSLTTQPAGSQWDLLGAGEGNPVWILPQYQDPNLLYLGTNDEHTDPADLLSYIETDPRLPHVAVPWIKASVLAVRGPGDFSLFSTDSFGTPTVWVDTADNPNGHTGGPLDNSDALWLIAGGHVHYNWAFTARGYYAMDVQATAFLPDGTPTSSPVVTYYLSAEQPGCLEFGTSDFTVDEAAGTATITVSRSHGSDGPVTVNLATSDGTAQAGVDYTATSVPVSFADGQTSQTVTIPINVDGFVENNETINLTLSNPTGGAELGGRTTAVLTINEDNDVATVQSVQPNPGSGQPVTSLTLTFSDIVTAGHGSAGIDSGAFELVRYDGGPAITVDFNVTTVNHQTVVTLTFSGDDVVDGALPDGAYTLVVHHDKVHDFLGNDLNGGSDFTFDFSSPPP